jgi:hypothetical protein
MHQGEEVGPCPAFDSREFTQLCIRSKCEDLAVRHASTGSILYQGLHISMVKYRVALDPKVVQLGLRLCSFRTVGADGTIFDERRQIFIAEGAATESPIPADCLCYSLFGEGNKVLLSQGRLRSPDLRANQVGEFKFKSIDLPNARGVIISLGETSTVEHPPQAREPARKSRPPVPAPDIRLIGHAAKALSFTEWRFNGKTLESEMTYLGGERFPPEIFRTDIEVSCYRENRVLLDSLLMEMAPELKRGKTCEVSLQLDVLLGGKVKRLQYIEIDLQVELE